ncbi:hypothetical protein ETW23_05585 [Leisingera sp. NJS201]|nr:hypothetical protein ETW23_05585 [Leisingera sp. NJS201]
MRDARICLSLPDEALALWIGSKIICAQMHKPRPDPSVPFAGLAFAPSVGYLAGKEPAAPGVLPLRIERLLHEL